MARRTKWWEWAILVAIVIAALAVWFASPLSHTLLD
jgi:hypothetical protein